MLAGAPLFIMLVMAGGRRAIGEVFSRESMLSGLVIIAVFIAFYFAGSAAVNPRAWLWNAVSIKQWWPQLLLFYGLSWGLLALLLWPVVRNMDAHYRRGFYVVVLALWVLSLLWYGLFSDMMVRGSALLMFAFMVYVALVLHRLCVQRRWLIMLPIMAVLCVGAMSPFWNVHDAVQHYDVKREPVRAPDHPAASQFLGPDDTFFQQYLAAPQ
jgi:hypothetical protein